MKDYSGTYFNVLRVYDANIMPERQTQDEKVPFIDLNLNFRPLVNTQALTSSATTSVYYNIVKVFLFFL